MTSLCSRRTIRMAFVRAAADIAADRSAVECGVAAMEGLGRSYGGSPPEEASASGSLCYWKPGPSAISADWLVWMLIFRAGCNDSCDATRIEFDSFSETGWSACWPSGF